MRAHKWDVLLAFKACKWDSDSDAVHLAYATQAVCCQIFREAKPFTGFPDGYEEKSAATVACSGEHGPGRAALAFAQLLKFNSVKHKQMPMIIASITV